MAVHVWARFSGHHLSEFRFYDTAGQSHTQGGEANDGAREHFRIAKGALPVEEALEVCRQIAEGVEAAHEKGVIHRDLKPANVKVTPEGKVKILDFGLAKAFEVEPPVTDISQSPTLTEEMTRAGVILGTAAYMSPEQARGEEVDKRSDVFAFGCVLYELLTGKRTFGGKTVTDTLAKVLEGEPNWKALPATTPWRIQELLRRCLTKDAHDRLRDIAHLRIEIKLALEEPTTVSPIGVYSTVQSGSRRWAMTAGVVALTAIVTSLAIWSLIPSSPPAAQPLTQLVITPPATAPLSDIAGNELAISPDGRLIVYSAISGSTTQLYVRPLDGLTAEPIPGTEGVITDAFFSPDGESVAFFAEGKLKKVALQGGPPITLGEVLFVAPYGSWGPGGTIVFTTGAGGLYSISAAGGTPERLAVPDPDKDELSYRRPKILPDGKTVLLTVWRGFDDQQIMVLSLETGEKRIVVEGGRDVHYAPTGHLIYGLLTEGALVAAPFDLARLEVTGDPVRIVEGVRESSSRSIDYALSDAGTLVYVSDRQLVQRSLVWVDRQGMETPVAEEKRDYTTPRLSPDGTRLSVTTTDRQGRNIWICEIDRGILTPFTFVRGRNVRAIWMRDGSRLTFHSHRIGQDIFSKAADGSTEAELLSTSLNGQIPTSWSADSKELAFQRRSGIGEVGSDWDIWVLSAEGEREPQPFLVTQFNERDAMFSPDGQWIAFTSDRSGQDEVYVKRYPGEAGIVQISANGGTLPVWARSGDELFYRTGEKMMVVPVRTNPSLNVGEPKLLFEGNYVSDYDVTADGQRFVMIKPGEQESASINVVLNWFEELKRLVPTN